MKEKHPKQTINILIAYKFSNNIREFKNTIENAATLFLCTDKGISLIVFPHEVHRKKSFLYLSIKSTIPDSYNLIIDRGSFLTRSILLVGFRSSTPT